MPHGARSKGAGRVGRSSTPGTPNRVLKVRKTLDADRVNRRPRGRPKNVDNENSVINISRPTGTSVAAALRASSGPDIFASVLAGEISAHAGMVEAGFRRVMMKRARNNFRNNRGKSEPNYVGRPLKPPV
jgi:hypothetical protein